MHESDSDPRLHYTVDVYQLDGSNIYAPIGCLHVYSATQLLAFKPRSKAVTVSSIIEATELRRLIFVGQAYQAATA